MSREASMLERMRGRVTVVVTMMVVGAGCREPDLGPLRADLATSAESVCAGPPVRAVHAVRTREVQAAEIEAATKQLCEAELAHAATPAEPLAAIHEALLQDRAVVGQLRRSRMMIDAARIDLGSIRPTSDGMRTAEEALTKAAAQRCGVTWPGLDRSMLAAAATANKADRAAEALDRCADVVALARDEVLTGDMTDVLLANGQLQRAVQSCTPLVESAPKEAAAKLATSLGTLRATFPKTLDDVRRRDRAEMILFAFGKGAEPSQVYPCERARELAAGEGPGGRPVTRGDRVDLEKSWKAAKADTDAPDPKYEEAYTLSVALLDRLIARAAAR